jgi:hypothetical protein
MSIADHSAQNRSALFTEDVLRTLELLARKKAGQGIAFVNIAAARKLCDLGLATRSRQGWNITPAGSAELARRRASAK